MDTLLILSLAVAVFLILKTDTKSEEDKRIDKLRKTYGYYGE